MNDAEEQVRREVALFRYGLIADLVHLPPGTPGIGDKLRAKAERGTIRRCGNKNKAVSNLQGDQTEGGTPPWTREPRRSR